MLLEHCLPIGRFLAVLYQGDDIVEIREGQNFVTDGGLKHLAGRLSASPPPVLSHMGVGTGTGQERTSTTLAQQTASGRMALSSFPQAASPNENLAVATAVFAAGHSTGSLTEGGLFTASTGGVMFNYFLLSPAIDKTASQSLTVVVSVAVGSLSA